MSRARDLANLGDGIDTSSITSGTFADARIAQSNVTQHESAIDALGTVTSATLGANVIFNDAHKDIRIDDSICLALNTNTSISSSSLMSTSAIWTEVWKGSGITHPHSSHYGRFEVAKAGIYLVWWTLNNSGSTNTTQELFLTVNGHYINSSNIVANNRAGTNPRSFLSGADELNYPPGNTMIFAVPLDAQDHLHLYGQGAFYGDPSLPMGGFGAIRLGDH